jgi:deoxycytidine triphosphate deaminase
MEVQDRTFNPSEAKPISTEGGLISGKLIDEWGLIAQGYDKQKALQRSSYDLHLGDYHCVTNKKGEWEYLFIGEEKDAHYLSFDLPIGDSHAIIIPPFGSAIIQLNECIDTLSVFINRQILVAGRFDLKLSTIYKGLISQQATQVEPCYYGRLFCFVHNLSSKEIHLKHKDKVATIEFLRICSEGTDYDEEKEKYIAGLVEMATAEGTQETNKYCVKGSFRFLYKGIIINHNKNRANLH